MSSPQKIRVAIVGLGFGAAFVPSYLHHPNVESLTICDTDENKLNLIGDRYKVEKRTTRLDDILNSSEIDAVHLLTPIPLHAQNALSVLEVCKHCACTVPMATNLDDLKAIVATQRKSGKNYMGMETAVYTRRFLYVKAMMEQGEIGKIQFLRGAHYQDMEGWPSYWMGLPPMYYATHAIGPIFALANTRAKAVHCFGSGTMRPELHEQYGNPFPVETAIFEMDNPTPLAAEVTRSLFHTARDYTESFNIYGEKATFEWEQIEDEQPIVFHMTPQEGRGSKLSVERIDAPDRQDLLPQSIARFTQRSIYDETDPHRSFLQGGGHGGSHPHLVHEFVSSIIENRQPWPDAVTTANWVAAGICAHESAMQGGARVEIPDFSTI